MTATARGRLGSWALASCLAVVCSAGIVRAQTPSDKDLADFKARLDALQKHNDLLQKQVDDRLKAMQQPVSAEDPAGDGDARINKLIDGYMKDKDAKKKEAEDRKKQKEKEEGYEVGSALGMNARWDPVFGFTCETAHKDFSFHIGGFFQEDFVWWREPGALRGAGGVGTLEDGTFFRRFHLQMDGVAWEVMEYNLQYIFDSFGNNVGTGTVEQFYVGLKDMPFIGTVRVGQMRVPQGLEGDTVTGAKAMTFLERSSYTDAFYDIFAPGIWVGNHVMDDRATWAVMAYKQEGGVISTTSANEPAAQALQQGTNNGAAIMDGNWGYSARITGLPVYENDGRCLVHVGASGTCRSALFPEPVGAATITGGPRFVDFSARPELRDTNGNYTNVGPGNAKRWVDTGLIRCENASVVGLEYLSIHGPLSIQAEWGLANANGVQGVLTPAGVLVASPNTLGFNGGYVQVSYFLTGENRLYDRRLGRLGGICCKPNTPFWFVRDGDGRLCTGLGAFELAARYSYLNLNDGPAQGGILGNTCIGLNWYLNNMVKLQFEYMNTNRWGMTAASPAGGLEGAIDAFGIRAQIAF